MKKKYLTMAVMGIGIVFAVSLIWLVTRPKVLGNFSHSFSASEPETNTSTISFYAKENDTIRLYFASDIKQGELDLILYDSKGNQVKELDHARELVTYLTIHYDDTYTLAANYVDFAGSFKAQVCAVE
ncbi:MAG: hypothetical protein K2O34_05290 [Acetatifactor sp.]|nr:hypothetical protein [Acetatifactor sp.]